MACRRCQLCEEVCSAAAREAEGGGGAGGSAWLDEQRLTVLFVSSKQVDAAVQNNPLITYTV
eukprot:7349579-Pyramimonas_sp.AAC.1